jgi:hypothetical protein
MISVSELDNHQVNDGYGESVYTKMIKAGHRTYFLDVKTTRSKDYFISITELRKKNVSDGSVTERNKVFIYEEDLEKFADGIQEVIQYMRERVGEGAKGEE